MSFLKPERIQKGVFRDDVSFLSAAGRKGAEAANKAKAEVRAEAEEQREILEAERAERDAQERAAADVAANYHLLTPDGEDPNKETEV